MATPNGSPVKLEPERRLANLLAKDAFLTPPVDVEALLGARATVEYAAIPGSCDALFLQNGDTFRVIISNRRRVSTTRLRFTMAHELGHIIIPWHKGTIFCQMDMTVSVSDHIRREIEAEANRFAAELLVPTTWLEEQLSAASDPASGVVSASTSAEVSPEVVLYSASRILPRTLLAIVDGFGKVEAIAHDHQKFKRVQKGSLLDFLAFHRIGAHVSHCSAGARLVVSVSMPPAAKDLEQTLTLRPSSEIRDEILEEVCSSPQERKHLTQSIAGIVGHFNGKKEIDAPAAYAADLKLCFVHRENLRRFVLHSQFDDFVNARAVELLFRRKSQQKVV